MANIPLIVVQLNEINFDIARKYVQKYDCLPAFKQILSDFEAIETYGESSYEELEPWIQWVSAHTGKTYSEHGVFRLGDIVSAPDSLVQIFEFLEAKGLRVGAISPMNTRNILKHPAYFIPDPWTDTPSDGSRFSVRFTEMLRQTVNDNAAGRVNSKSLMTLIGAILGSIDSPGTLHLLSMVFQSRAKPWMRSLVLDQLLHLVHKRKWSQKKPDVSFVFFNAGAHVQHHYFFNSPLSEAKQRNPEWYVPASADPIRDMLVAYDRILQDYLDISRDGARLVIATGLTQVPYDRAKYYYRLRDHGKFLAEAGIAFERVLPRMTRDFEIQFASSEEAQIAVEILQQMRMQADGEAVFGELDVRDRSIFATFSYPNEIKLEDTVQFGNRTLNLGGAVAFVAIKNGMHNTKGFVFVSKNSSYPVSRNPMHISELFSLTEHCSR